MGTVIILIIAFLLIRGAVDYYKSEYGDKTDVSRTILYAEDIVAYIGELVSSYEHIRFLQYFTQLAEVAQKYKENGLIAQEMEGKIIAIKDTIHSVFSKGKETYVVIGKEPYSLAYEDCTCSLVGPSKEQARELKAGEIIIVIGILGCNSLGKLRLDHSQILYMNGDYVPAVKKNIYEKYGDVELSVY